MEIKKKKKHLQRLEESSQNVRHVENVAAEKVRRKSFFFFKSRNYCKGPIRKAWKLSLGFRAEK